jgi:two-component system sensor histidine kinase KdpD
VFASLLSIASFDFLFVPPRFTFAVSDVRYILTFAVMLAAALVASHLTLRIRAQAQTARDRERRTGAVYAMSRALAAARTPADLITIATHHLTDTFGADMRILMPDQAGRLDGGDLDEKERSVAQWVFDHNQRAGAGTDTLPSAGGLYVPLVASSGVIGVLGVRAGDPARFEDPTLLQLLETFAGQAALALERAQLADRAQKEEVEVEAERLRTSLLSSLSHDMRTPLGAITGAASSLLEEPGKGTIAEPARRELLQSILDEANRMNRLIGNLLDMIRVESGALKVQKEWQPLEEPVGVALIRLQDRLREHPVEVHLPPDLPLVPMDGVLIEQVFVNLLENAVKYTPPGTPIEISGAKLDGRVRVDVVDRGPGVPAGEERRIFDKFYRVAGEGPVSGVGLGLTICRGIITAHGGRIWVENRPGGGALFRFTLPLGAEPPPSVPGEPGAE